MQVGLLSRTRLFGSSLSAVKTFASYTGTAGVYAAPSTFAPEGLGWANCRCNFMRGLVAAHRGFRRGGHWGERSNALSSSSEVAVVSCLFRFLVESAVHGKRSA